ncbi:helix-turn-helix domain-containing protein [Candidatus Enterococcus ferrettii]|uniref:Mga helix-turn-helix domain-containing protein n=1 Tax=Candidatus Enterococcus ferrettii TaxID=2815324 RepID=A0ABV0EQ26_9ENTE|nr:helix-turn-helix domain-containing protein [Enterococcus sp. 665A]MBO1341345.1 helix-turn-helix domain-containing protein [Enterococcus sp. 665A]
MNSQELIKEYILDKKSSVKLSILQFLSDHLFYITNDYLADHFHMSKLNFSLYLKELEQDILSLKIYDDPILKKNNFIKSNIPYNDLTTYYYHLLIKYCENSTNYNILISLLRKDTKSILNISQQTNFSVSYIYSRMKNINAFLFYYGIKIDFSKPGKKTIIGDELQIHYCIIDVYWNIYSNIDINFNQDYEHLVKPTLNNYVKREAIQNLENGMLDKLYVLIHLCLKNFPINSWESVQQEFKDMPDTETFANEFFDILKPDLHLGYELRIVINLLSRLMISKTETLDINLKQYQFLKERKSKYFDYSKELIEAFVTEFNLTIPQNDHVIYTLNFIRNQMFYDLLTENHPNTTMASYTIYNEKTDKRVREKIILFYESFNKTKTARYPFIQKQNPKWLLEDLLHIYDRYSEREKIQIGVNFTRDYYINDDLCSQIEQHFGSENIILKKKVMKNCDIIISDCLVKYMPEKTKIIYLIDGDITSEKIKDMFKQLSDHIFDLRQE